MLLVAVIIVTEVLHHLWHKILSHTLSAGIKRRKEKLELQSHWPVMGPRFSSLAF